MGDRTNFAARGLEHTFRWSQTSFTELDFTGCTRVKYCEIYQKYAPVLYEYVFRRRDRFPSSPLVQRQAAAIRISSVCRALL